MNWRARGWNEVTDLVLHFPMKILLEDRMELFKHSIEGVRRRDSKSEDSWLGRQSSLKPGAGLRDQTSIADVYKYLMG